jgi:hypothetical protein
MPLVPASLAASLANDWLVPEGGSYPGSVADSADRFAAAVASWFSGAMAAGFPCATATARRPQLSGSAIAAFTAQNPDAAGAMLAIALMGYMAGQAFGPGIASPPTATAAAQTALAAVFRNLNADNQARAQRIALAVHALALTTIVVFPPVISPPLPVV